MPILTVAIPTFNRARQLEKRLEEIEKYWTPEIAVCVFDNASTDDTPEVAARFAGRFPLRYERLPVNTGALRNVIRCFEEPETEWVWPLSDDDGLTADSLSSALACIARTEADAIHFSTYGGGNPADVTISTLEEYFRIKHDPCALLVISATLYRRAKLQPLFRVLIAGAYTLIPHALLVLTMLGGGLGKLELLERCLLEPKGLSTKVRWSTREFAVGVSVLPGFFSDPGHQRLAAMGLRAATRYMLLFALREVVTTTDARRWRRSVRQVNATLSLYGGTFQYELRQTFIPPLFQLRQTAGVLVARWLPDRAVVRLAERLRNRWGVSRPANDFLETSVAAAKP